MREPIENEYFNWLCAKVLDRGSRSYNVLLSVLYATEFTWVVPADSHRVKDGLELRQDFLMETGMNDNSILEQPCSILEVFIAFAKRASFQTDIPVRDWFWEFMANLQLDDYRQASDSDVRVIDNILYTFIWRTYDPSGFGGMFPMSQTHNDQRRIEIWYQFCEYLEDKGLI